MLLICYYKHFYILFLSMQPYNHLSIAPLQGHSLMVSQWELVMIAPLHITYVSFSLKGSHYNPAVL